MRDFEHDIRGSMSDMELLRPKVEGLLGCKVVSVEGETGDADRALDMLGGFDYLCVYPQGVRGMASRIQRGRSWRTFTVRAARDSGSRTEFEKRTFGIENGFLYPYYTMQAYVGDDGGELAICHTEELMRAVASGECERRRTTNAEFYVVPWDMVLTVRA